MHLDSWIIRYLAPPCECISVHPQVTAVLEILQPTYQHVVDLSHLQRGELNFIAWTLPYDDDDKGRVHADSYCAMNPQVRRNSRNLPPPSRRESN